MASPMTVEAASQPLNAVDRRFLRRAFSLAENGYSSTSPNPRVGCVLVRDRKALAEAFHRAAGLPHAEAEACAMVDGQASGATAYVSLEPCSHHGRTPPCTDALLEQGIERVVFGARDINPQVNGRGEASLREAGVDVLCAGWEREHLLLNPGYECAFRHSRPWLRLKLATSIDGYIALADGQSKWLSGEPARADNQRWRARSDAVLTTWRTAEADGASLNVRKGRLRAHQPKRIVLDRNLRSLPTARVYALDPSTALVLCCRSEETAATIDRDWQGMLEGGLEIVSIEPESDDVAFLRQCLQAVFAKGIREIQVEAGAAFGGFLLDKGFVDELLLYQAPKLLGSGLAPRVEAPSSPDACDSWPLCSYGRFGEDMRLQYLHHRWAGVGEAADV